MLHHGKARQGPGRKRGLGQAERDDIWGRKQSLTRNAYVSPSPMMQNELAKGDADEPQTLRNTTFEEHSLTPTALMKGAILKTLAFQGMLSRNQFLFQY